MESFTTDSFSLQMGKISFYFSGQHELLFCMSIQESEIIKIPIVLLKNLVTNFSSQMNSSVEASLEGDKLTRLSLQGLDIEQGTVILIADIRGREREVGTEGGNSHT